MPTHTQNTGGLKVAIAKLDKTSYKKFVQKSENIVKHSCGKIRVATLWCKLESRCAESTTRGRRGKVQVEQVDRASRKN